LWGGFVCCFLSFGGAQKGGLEVGCDITTIKQEIFTSIVRGWIKKELGV